MPAIHLRRQIREAVASAVTGLATTGSRVHQSRLRPQGDTALPCLLVAGNDETIDAASVGIGQERTLRMHVTGMAKASADLDDTLDGIALEVEAAMAADPTFGGKATASALSAIQVDFDDSMDKPVGEIRLEYRVTYFTNAGSPGTLA